MPTAVAPRGKTIDFLLKTQSAFGTPATGNYTKTYILSHSLVMKKPFVDDPVLGLPRTNNRDVTAPAPGLVVLAGNIVVPLDYNHIGMLIEASFGAATDTGSADPYTHVFTSGGEVLPFLTGEVEIQTPAGAIFMQYGSLLVSKWTLQAARKAGEEKMTFEMMGQLETELGSTGGGTPATPWARDMVTAAIGTFNINGSAAANIIEINATYDNKPKPQDYLGQAQGLISGIDLDAESTFSGTLKLRFRDLTMYNHAIAADSFEGTIFYSRTANRLVQFDAPVMRVEPAGIEIAGPAGIEQNFTFRCEQTNSAPMLTTTLKNLVATYGS
jgi:hypothetical protein